VIQALGTTGGLPDVGNQLWRQGSDEILETEEVYDRFGYALAPGDFDDDGYADLAVGVPYEDIETTADAGLVHIIQGSQNDLTSTGNQIWYQGYEGVLGNVEEWDRFGWSLAALPTLNDHIYLPLILRSD
jgi:hypothetical protein